jgi:hypothetical protein
MTTSNKPLNITINGGEEDIRKKQDVYENYIIITNHELKKESDELKNEMRELKVTFDELEEDLSKEEKSKTYMKGLMHNLYDMQKKAKQINDLRETMFIEHNQLIKDYLKKKNKINLIPTTSLYLNIREYYILSFILVPLLIFMTDFINYQEFAILCFISIFPGTTLYLYIKHEHTTMFHEYNNMNTSYNTKLTKINRIEAEIDEIDNSCRCLDTYIDEL